MGHRTGVDEGNIRRVAERDSTVSLVFQGVDDGFRFELIDFTAQSGNGDGGHGISLKSNQVQISPGADFVADDDDCTEDV
jgi:hypothetical protein